MKKISIALFVLIVAAFASHAQTVKVMSYNIRLDIAVDGEKGWKFRKDFLASQIAFYDADVFGVQEALPNQMSDLATLLPEYAHVGIGRDGDGKGEASAVFYKKDRFKVLQSGTFWLSETPDKISKGWDAAYNRVCSYGLFRDLKSKKRFWAFNTHLDHIGAAARKNGVELILARIKSLNEKNYPVILTGDLNLEPDSVPIKILKNAMTDTRDVSAEKPFGPSGTFNGFKFNEPVTRLIDYIFIDNSKRFEVRKYAILSDSKDLRYPSDHFPVFAELYLN